MLVGYQGVCGQTESSAGEGAGGNAKFSFKSKKKWWRRGESKYSYSLKTRKLLKNKNAENAQTSKIGPNWNVSGTWDFRPSRNK
jgi:hypothetical protein